MSTIDEHATVSEPSDDRQTGTAPAPRMAAGNAPEVSSGRGQEATTTRDPLETATSSLPETATGNTPPAASGSGQGTTSGDPAEATTSSAPETTTSNAPEAATTLTEPAHVDLVIGGDEEHDSTYGGSEGSGMSASLASTVFDYVYEVRLPFSVPDGFCISTDNLRMAGGTIASGKAPTPCQTTNKSRSG